MTETKEQQAQRIARELQLESVVCFGHTLHGYDDDVTRSEAVTYRRNDIPFFARRSEGKWRVSYMLPRFPKYLEEPNYVDGDYCDTVVEAEKSLLEHLELLRSGLAVAHNITLKAQEELHGYPGRPEYPGRIVD